MRIAVVGLWHLGSVTAACLAQFGHQVDIVYLEGMGHAHRLALPLLSAVRPSNDAHKLWVRLKLLPWPIMIYLAKWRYGVNQFPVGLK